MTRKKSEKGPPPLEDLPANLRKAVVRIMVKYNLDIEDALEKLAILSDINSREFNDAVKKRAESLYKSRLMTQMNAARVSLNRKANAQLIAHYDRGYKDGHAQGKEDNAIYYYCSICGKPIYVTPNRKGHQAVVNYMHEHGWGHQSCHDKKR